MKSFVAVCLSSAVFAIVISVVYWFVAHREPAGTLFLAVMAIALIFATLYAVFAERDADLEGDRENTTPPQWAGDDLGIFTPQSAWPILVAVCATFGLLGLLWSPLIAALALAALILCLWRLGAESARQR